MDYRDADRFELSDVQNFVAVQIVNVAVRDEIKIRTANGACSWQACKGRAIFENCGFRYARSVVGEFQ